MKGSQGKRMRRETGKPVLVGISASRLRLVSYPSQRYGWGLMSDMITGYSIAAVGCQSILHSLVSTKEKKTKLR
jgi:hypothetical protein